MKRVETLPRNSLRAPPRKIFDRYVFKTYESRFSEEPEHRAALVTLFRHMAFTLIYNHIERGDLPRGL
jgi:hypothetical protein